MADDLANALAGEDLEKQELRRKIASLEKKLVTAGDLQAQLAIERATVEKIEREFNVIEGAKNLGAAKWLTAVPKSKIGHHATAWLMLSDLHLDEVVLPGEVRHMNAFNREIALGRLQRLTENFIKVTRDYWTGIIYDGAVVPLGGDLFSGEIHEELKETNEDTMLASFYYWIGPIVDSLLVIADTFGKVHIPVVVGNHGRTTRKPRAKFRARSNFDWLFGQIIAQHLAGDKRFTFDIPDSADCRIPSYGDHVLLTHGDQIKGGSGIGGIWPPIMRMIARKQDTYSTVGEPFDLMILGHWHQLVHGKNFIVNGSLKGFDEYAAVSNFGFEPPQQAAWLMSPEHGRTWTAPVICQSREDEGW